jgi:hypothetical protein
MTDEQQSPQQDQPPAPPPERPPAEESPFTPPAIQEIGKSHDPPGVERRDD